MPCTSGPARTSFKWTGQGVRRDPATLVVRQKIEDLRDVGFFGEGSELQDLGEEQLKLSTIREIRRATGSPPPIYIVVYSLKTEEALRLEAIRIATLDVRPLTNVIRGHGLLVRACRPSADRA